MAMTDQEQFAAALELALRRAAHRRDAVAAFVTDHWPLVRADQDGKCWAQRFIDGGAATAKG